MAERRNYRVRFQAPQIPASANTERYFQLSRETRWFSNRGPCQELLEARMAAELGGGVSVVPVSNATAGLMVAIRALIGVASERRYVIVPSYTFIATVSAILWAGYEPLFVDVDIDGWHLEPDAVEAAVANHGDSVALIMACATFGNPHPLDTLGRLRAAARGSGVPLLVDAAAGFGSARPDGSGVSCEGDLDVYSFHATKPFAIGEGGLVVSSDGDRAELVASLINFGFDVTRDVRADVGINAKMDEWHCATALAVLDDFPAVLDARRRKAEYVKAALAPHGFAGQAGSDLACNQFVAVLAPSTDIRTHSLQLARDRGIEFRAYYDRPLHQAAALHHFPRADPLANTIELAGRALSLPLANDISEADLDAVIEVCIDAARSPRD
jgi:dTDP-4-amino-4,6-dideoxygalactose transaminase